MHLTCSNIAKAIFKTAKEKDIDFRDLLREWAMLFERTEVEGWNRIDFLNEIIREKEKHEVVKNEAE